jgi:type VI secretion system lysozyme-like protein
MNTDGASLINKLSDNNQSPTKEVIDNIHDILNTKHDTGSELDNFTEAKASVINYGLENFSHYQGSPKKIGDELAKAIKEQLETFEPRLRDVAVKLNSVTETLNFTITAVLRDDDQAEITLSSMFEPRKQIFDTKNAD